MARKKADGKDPDGQGIEGTIAAARQAAKSSPVKRASTKKAPASAPEAPAPEPEVDVRTRLLRDVRDFNAWRKQNLGAAIDLRDADLRGADLRDAFLAGARMDGCQLDDAGLCGAVFSGASLDGASLRRADLRGACFGRLELIESSLALSPVGGALVRGASLRGASLVAARAQQAIFLEADLTDADLEDCDLRDANLRRARVEGVRRGPPPPTADDAPALLARLAEEQGDVRNGLALFSVLVFLGGDRGDDAKQFLVAIGKGIGVSQGDLQKLVPVGRIVLESYTISPPPSDWARRVYFALMCALASCSASVMPAQLQVLGHFGAQYGLTDRAMARVIREELGIQLTVAE